MATHAFHVRRLIRAVPRAACLFLALHLLPLHIAYGAAPESGIDDWKSIPWNTLSVARLIELTGSDSAACRQLAVVQLGSRRDSAAILAVRQLLSDQSPPVRAAAIYTLAGLETEEEAFFKHVSPMVSDSDSFVRREAIWSLCSTGVVHDGPDRLFDAVVDLAASERDPDVRDRLLGCICRTFDPEHREAHCTMLERMVRSTEPQYRDWALSGLLQIGDKGAIPILLEIGLPNPNFRVQTIHTLSRFKDAGVSKVLIHELENEKSPASISALIVSLRILEDPSAIPVLRTLANHPEASIRREALSTLGYYFKDKGSTTLFLHALDDEAASVRATAAMVFANVPDPAAVPRLKELLKDTDKFVQQNAESALENFQTIQPRTYEDLARTVEGPYSRVRSAAVLDLGLHWPRSAALLRSLLKDPDGEVRVAAAGALLAHGDHVGEKLIDDVMQTGDHDALLYVAQAIGSQGPELTVRTLLGILANEKKSEVQRLSAAVLLDDFASEPGADRAAIESGLMRFLGVKTPSEMKPELMRRTKGHIN